MVSKCEETMSYHGLGQASTTLTNTTTATVASIQCALRARGASISVDGRFGPNTRAALVSQQTAYLPSVIGLLFQDASTGASSIQINKTFYEWLMGSGSCRGATPSAPTPGLAPPADEAIIEDNVPPRPEPELWKAFVPIGGAVALVGLGVYFLKRRRG
jgi:peptidoglycan hydrolase-like protein with peptidoglycan-binding domain